IGLLAEFYFVFYKEMLWSFYSVAYIIHTCGYSSFYANIIQYNIDQLVGASADELSSVIYWHILSQPLVDLFYYLLQCLFYGSSYFIIITFIVSGVSVSLVLVSHSFFKHKLENISLIKNPIKLIVRVLCYARKHKYPQNRSALTYWEEEAPSRLDLGKDKYGGPFTEEEVEDVKTVFRMLPLFIGFVALNFSDDSYSSVIDRSFTLPTCLAVTDSIVCFNKNIPSMLTRMSVGIFLAFIVTVSKVIIFVIERSHPDINNLITLLFFPQTIQGLTFILFYPVSLEFTVAQSPVHMRGVMVGLWYATAWGLSYLNSIIAKFLFDCESQYICTSFYYYITKSVLVLIILIVFVILAKRYKYRVRENEVNIVQIVDDHYQRYMEQEEQYKKNRTDDIQYSIQ
uniref:Major facilitator superfamily associated domain-containing protein n=1 Tax=Amphimedon queenslandica TaxID=400682 RepID=A0A1X7SMJ1_AMPQE